MPASPKSDDHVIIGLNSVGLSLGRIGRELDVHHTTITHRLKNLGIAPADTRRAFMEEIYDSLGAAQKQWLVDQLSSGHTIKSFVRSLIVKEFINRNQSK